MQNLVAEKGKVYFKVTAVEVDYFLYLGNYIDQEGDKRKEVRISTEKAPL